METFTEQLRRFDDAGLDAYQFRLLIHYWRVGQCWESLRTTADKCEMSVGKTHEVRNWLLANNWIEFQPVNIGKKSKMAIVICSPHEQTQQLNNAKRSPDEQKRSPDEQKDVADVHHVNAILNEPNILNEPKEDNRQIVLQAYQNNIGSLTIGLEKSLYAAVDTYSLPWVIDAILEAKKRGVYKWAYIQTILKNWQVEGRGGRQSQNGSGPNPGEEAWQRVLKCVTAGNYKSLGRESKEAELLREQFDPSGILTASEKDLSFIGKRFVEAFNHAHGNH